MIYHDFLAYLTALNSYNSTPGKIINGEGFYVVNDELIPDKEFFAHNSKPVYEAPQKINVDGTYIHFGAKPQKAGRK